MPTLRAAVHNPWLNTHYERLKAAGKPKEVALIPCPRKLLGAIHSVAKNRKPFVPHVTSALAKA
ncbi:MAG: hypothetical protein RIT81_24265 [Deltaproteobacteria bacterium]